jgi:S1-C subfamily serine protease
MGGNFMTRLHSAGLLPFRLLVCLLAWLAAACDGPPPQPPGPAAAAITPGASAVVEALGVAVRSTANGVTIVALELDGPAAASGAEVGDVIVAVNGKRISGAEELVSAAASASRMSLELMRSGESRRIAVGPGEIANAAGAGWTPIGLQVREVPPAALQALGVPYGVMVTKVRSPADRSRILPGDVIVGVDQTAIRSVDEFHKLIAERASQSIGLLVRRIDADLYISLEPGADSASGGGSQPRRDDGFKSRKRPTGTPLRT